MIKEKTTHPITSPMPMPVNMDFLARCSFPAPTFCDTKDAIDCINELGISIAKFTILHATPYPDDAVSPSLFTKAHNATKDNCVRHSCRASGNPIFMARLQFAFILKSCFSILNGSCFLTRRIIANTTLTACANTVAIAAPAASIPKCATKVRSPIILITHAIATNISGDLLSPSPRKIAASTLYATIKNIPPPHILIYEAVASTASTGDCISTAIWLANNIITTKSTTDMIANTTVAPPITGPISCVFFSPIYLAISTVIPIANCITTKVTRFKT